MSKMTDDEILAKAEVIRQKRAIAGGVAACRGHAFIYITRSYTSGRPLLRLPGALVAAALEEYISKQ